MKKTEHFLHGKEQGIGGSGVTGKKLFVTLYEAGLMRRGVQNPLCNMAFHCAKKITDVQNSFTFILLSATTSERIRKLECFQKSPGLACMWALQMVIANRMSNGPTLLIHYLSLVATD